MHNNTICIFRFIIMNKKKLQIKKKKKEQRKCNPHNTPEKNQEFD